MDTIRLAGIVKQSITDGPGLRLTVFTQGCPHHCEGCHNPETWSYSGGKDYVIADIIALVKANPLLKGITLSGGEPIDQSERLLPLAKAVISLGKDVVCYTGYIYEDLLKEKNPAIISLLETVSILVDGPYIKGERDISSSYKGSTNQRVIDVPASLSSEKTVLFTD